MQQWRWCCEVNETALCSTVIFSQLECYFKLTKNATRGHFTSERFPRVTWQYLQHQFQLNNFSLVKWGAMELAFYSFLQAKSYWKWSSHSLIAIQNNFYWYGQITFKFSGNCFSICFMVYGQRWWSISGFKYWSTTHFVLCSLSLALHWYYYIIYSPFLQL